MYKHHLLLGVPNPIKKLDVKSLFRVHLTTNGTGEDWDPKRFILTFKFGNGAGYINGFDMFFAFNAKKRETNERSLIQIGATQSANKVPYMDGV